MTPISKGFVFINGEKKHPDATVKCNYVIKWKKLPWHKNVLQRRAG